MHLIEMTETYRYMAPGSFAEINRNVRIDRTISVTSHHEGETRPSQIATALMTGRTMTRIGVGVVVTTIAVIDVGMVVVKLEVVMVAVDPGGVARIRLASGFGTLEDGVVIQTRTIITYDLHVYKN